MSEVPVAAFLRGVSSRARLGLVRWVAGQGVVRLGDLGLEWPAVSGVVRARVVATGVRSGWLAVGDGLFRVDSLVWVPAAAPARLLALLDALDASSVAAGCVDVADALDELRLLRLASTRDVLSRLAVLGPVSHPRELGLKSDRAWAGWSELHLSGWMAGGCLVVGRLSSLRALVLELAEGVVP